MRLQINGDDWEIANVQAAKFWANSVMSVVTIDDAMKAFESYHHYFSTNNYELAGSIIKERRINEWESSDSGESLGALFYRLGLLDPRQDLTTGRQVKLFNPRTQKWNRHFTWSADGTHIIGRTAIGRATVTALQLNKKNCAVMVRQQWISAGWHPPQEP